MHAKHGFFPSLPCLILVHLCVLKLHLVKFTISVSFPPNYGYGISLEISQSTSSDIFWKYREFLCAGFWRSGFSWQAIKNHFNGMEFYSTGWDLNALKLSALKDGYNGFTWRAFPMGLTDSWFPWRLVHKHWNQFECGFCTFLPFLYIFTVVESI